MPRKLSKRLLKKSSKSYLKSKKKHSNKNIFHKKVRSKKNQRGSGPNNNNTSTKELVNAANKLSLESASASAKPPEPKRKVGRFAVSTPINVAAAPEPEPARIGRFAVSKPGNVAAAPEPEPKTIFDIQQPIRIERTVLEIGETINLGDEYGIKFKIVKLVGEGGQGRVFKVELEDSGTDSYRELLRKNNNNREFAIKYINKFGDPKIKPRFYEEVKNLLKLTEKSELDPRQDGSNNFAKLYLSGETRSVYVLISEFVEGIELTNNYIQSIIPHIIKSRSNGILYYLKLFEQLLKGLSFLHKYDIIHRDIKMNNIIVTTESYFRIDDDLSPIDVPVIKYVDFGFSCGKHGNINTCKSPPSNNNNNYPLSLVGTTGYIDPSLLFEGSPNSKNIDHAKKTDIYSLGIVFYYLINHFHLFDTIDFFELQSEYKRLKYASNYSAIKSYRHIISSNKEIISGLESNNNSLRERTESILKNYQILDFITNCMVENNIVYRLDLKTLLSIFDGSYKYIKYVPGVEYLQSLNSFDIENNNNSNRVYTFNNKEEPSITHCLINAIEKKPNLKTKLWLTSVKKQHQSSIKQATKVPPYPYHLRRYGKLLSNSPETIEIHGSYHNNLPLLN